MSFSVVEAPTATEAAGWPLSASLSANANPPASAATMVSSLAVTEIPPPLAWTPRVPMLLLM
jgi:hypothetical protein